MSNNTKVICDHCEKDITHDCGYDEWYITVSSVKKLNAVDESGAPYAARLCLATAPQLRNRLEFCGLKCMREWINEK
jgi:hypothetical protein